MALSAPPADAPVAAPLPDQSNPADAVVLTWTVHLLRRRPHRLWRIGGCVLATLFCGLLLFHDLRLALLPAVALLLSLSEYLFPIHYTLSQQRAKMQYGPVTLEMPWRDVRHAYLTEGGIKISPLRARNSRFESLRGLFLHFGTGEQETLIATVRRLRAEASVHA